jgi:hypothetical protein
MGDIITKLAKGGKKSNTGKAAPVISGVVLDGKFSPFTVSSGWKFNYK